ncbi:MAG: pilus assembly protein PilM, partial [Sedimentisphaerales bacterium]|nr:pilus assembly protein PilM [Sedimentisphaerales bacterium]
HLRALGEKLEVVGFDHIEHTKILSSGTVSDSEKAEMIAASLRRFMEQNDAGKDEVYISVAGQTSFARFIKLPPVEAKRIPEIVKFEAVQQIPFDINEVEWDWQVMEKPDSPDVEVGIFAIKNEVIGGILDYFSRENLKVTGVQMAPIALYNYATYERGMTGEGDKSAVIVMDMGAENTDLVICTKTGVWQRSIPLGGNSFTRAVAEAFKLDFEKAEKLKRTAPMSKYARQIFQSMKPVFSDLAAELQRSLGFYGTANRDVKFQKVIAMGGGMRMQGLTKFLQQTIQLPIVRPDAFERIEVTQGVSAAKFHDNVADFGVVYGLAVQGLGLAKIQSNLLPRKIARAMTWTR